MPMLLFDLAEFALELTNIAVIRILPCQKLICWLIGLKMPFKNSEICFIDQVH